LKKKKKNNSGTLGTGFGEGVFNLSSAGQPVTQKNRKNRANIFALFQGFLFISIALYQNLPEIERKGVFGYAYSI
jgi:hypothetical protein